MMVIGLIKILMAMATLYLFRRTQSKWRNMLYVVLALLVLMGGVVTLGRI